MDKKERINDIYKQLIEQGICRNKKEFASLLGVNYIGLTKAMNGEEKNLTTSLVAKATAILAGNGVDILATPPAPSTETIPVIPTGARAGTLADWSESIHEYDCERIISPIKGADYAMQVTGDSMSPEYPSGSQIIIKKIDEDAFIEWGKVYLLDTKNGPVLKQVRKTDTAGVIECVSLNPAYQPFTVDCKYISGWYRVLMCLSLK